MAFFNSVSSPLSSVIFDLAGTPSAMDRPLRYATRCSRLALSNSAVQSLD
jgi:hypothetical protein